MAGPHRLVAAARNVLKAEFATLPVGAPVVLAVSGGGDSMALAASAQFAARENLLDLHAVVVDHGIRAESAQEAAEVAKRLVQIGLKAQVLRLANDAQSDDGEFHDGDINSAEVNNAADTNRNIRDGKAEDTDDVATAGIVNADIIKVNTHAFTGSGEGPEGAARRGRYLALAQTARKLGKTAGMAQPALVLLGHNANDQAESVILGLGRGSGARSISGMPRSGPLPICPDVPMLRPLLGFTHSELCTICDELGITYVEDPSNQLDGPWRTAAGEPLRRSRVRHEVLPLLESVLAGGVIGALGRTAALLQEDGAALDFYADLAWQASVQIIEKATENTENTGGCENLELKSETDKADDKAASNPLRAGEVPRAIEIEIACEKLAQYPRAIRTRVLRKAFLASGGRGGELVFWHLDRLDRLVKNRENNRSLDLPGVFVVKNHHILKFVPRD